ncbi:MAG TPA: CBS domain-containing protein [Gemmatimonadales bacterium]|jgi:CBS domain-containing protein
MKVDELMQRNVKTVRSDDSVAEAIVALADAHVSGMPVVDRAGKVVGVVSTTDVLAAEAESPDGVGGEDDWQNTPVRDIMTPHPFSIAPGDDVREAARQMLYAEVHRLFVSEGGQVVGIISTSDIVRAVATGML